MRDIWIKNCFVQGTVLSVKDNNKIISIACLKAPNDGELQECIIPCLKQYKKYISFSKSNKLC